MILESGRDGADAARELRKAQLGCRFAPVAEEDALSAPVRGTMVKKLT
jgi:hypothetical protein